MNISGACWPNGSQEASGGSFAAFLEPGGKIAPRRPLEAHFQHFWSQVAKWLPGGLWRLILRSSRARWQNSSQEASGGSFSAFLEPGGKIAPGGQRFQRLEMERPLGILIATFRCDQVWLDFALKGVWWLLRGKGRRRGRGGGEEMKERIKEIPAWEARDSRKRRDEIREWRG